MNPTQANSREYLQRTIDAEIKSLEESARALKLRRNALSPVSSLPPEVFTTIFSFVCLPPGKPGHHLSRLHVSHVCHQWRGIALNQPFLWSHVNFTALSSAGVAEILARAKTVPLYLEGGGHSGRWDRDDARFGAFQKELQRRVSRICFLRLSARPLHLRKTLEGLVSHAPTLEFLSLSTEEYRPRIAVPETLFGCTTPRLSCLELDNCDISWRSSLFKGLRELDMRSPSPEARPTLSVWLATLGEMPQLERLTLHSASPIAPPFPFDVERTVTLPSLTHLDISSSVKNCALALAHLDLPSLTWLCLRPCIHFPGSDDVQKLLLYVARHAHGPQDTQPLQSALVLNNVKYIDILAWTAPDIDVEVHGRHTLLAANPPTRVALSFTSKDWNDYGTRNSIIGMAMAVLPLDGLVTLIVKNLLSSPFGDAWLPNSPKWPLLRRVRLTHIVVFEFTRWVLADTGGRENPLLPSLKELVLVNECLSELSTLPLRDALMKRVEQGVPLEILDLRTCTPFMEYPAVQLLSEIVVNVLGPEETIDARAQIVSMWDRLAHGPFVGHDKTEVAYPLDTDDDTSSDIIGDDDDGEVENY